MTLHVRTLAALLVLSLAAGAAGADEDSKSGGDLQPVSPIGRYQIPFFQNHVHDNFCFALAPDGRSVVMTSHGPLTVYDLTPSPQPRNNVRQLMVENTYFNQGTVAFSPDGKTVAAAGPQHSNDSAIHILDFKTSKEIRRIENDEALTALAFSADGKRLAVGTQQRIELWDATDGDEIKVFASAENAHRRTLALSADGKMLASAGITDNIQVWETASGRERLHLRLPSATSNSNPNFRGYNMFTVGSSALSPDGRLLAAGGDQVIHIWDLRTGSELPPLVGHQASVRALVFSPDGKRLISFDSGGLKQVWSTSRILRSADAPTPHLSDREFEELWDELADADAFSAYRALRCISAEPKRALALLGKRLQPVPADDPKRIDQLVADLHNANGGKRRKAMMELLLHGEAALGALSEMPPPQRQSNRAIMNLINRLETKYATPERQRALKAVQILGQLDDPQARQILEKVAQGARGARLTVEAKAGLDRQKKPATKEPAAASDVKALWQRLASDDAAVAFRAMRGLLAQPTATLPLLREELKPVAPADVRRIEQLVKDLDSNEFAAREKATTELEELGESAEPALKKILTAQPSLEMRKRVQRLLETIHQGPSGKVLRTLRAIEVLEWIGTAESRQALESLAGGQPQAWPTREARASLDRLAKR